LKCEKLKERRYRWRRQTQSDSNISYARLVQVS